MYDYKEQMSNRLGYTLLVNCLSITNTEGWGRWEEKSDSGLTHCWLFESRVLWAKLAVCPASLFPCPPILLRWACKASPLTSQCYPPFEFLIFPSAFFLHLPFFTSLIFTINTCPVSSQRRQREKWGQITLQKQFSSSGLCVSEWLRDRSAGTHTSYHSHEDRLMACLFNRPHNSQTSITLPMNNKGGDQVCVFD